MSATEPIHFDCPHCSQHIAAEPDDAGRHVGCPTCNQTLVVPNHRGTASSPDAPAPASPDSTQPAPDPGADAGYGAPSQLPALLAELEAARTAAAELQNQLEAAGSNEDALRLHLDELEGLRAQEQAQAAHAADAAAAAESELRSALGSARGQLEVLLSERDALKAALETSQKASLGAEEQATERILAARRLASTAEAAREELSQKVGFLESEVRTLRTQLNQDTSGRDLLTLRDRVRELGEAYESKSVALAQATDALAGHNRETESLRKQLAEALRRVAELERGTEEASAAKLKEDNEVLRGMVKRQKSVCKRHTAALIGLRSANLLLRILQTAGTLLVLGLGALALEMLPEEVKRMIRHWLGMP